MESIGSLDISRFDEKVRLPWFIVLPPRRPPSCQEPSGAPLAVNLYVRLILMDGKSQESFQGISSSLMQMSILDVKMKKSDFGGQRFKKKQNIWLLRKYKLQHHFIKIASK